MGFSANSFAFKQFHIVRESPEQNMYNASCVGINSLCYAVFQMEAEKFTF